jgi:hypothetical protein
MMSLYPPTEISEGYTMEDVDEKYVITDGTRSLEMYYIQGLGSHVEGMLMAYLPKEQILIEADLYEPYATQPTPTNKALLDNVRHIGLDVVTIAPLHGQPVPWSDFLKVVGKM